MCRAIEEMKNQFVKEGKKEVVIAMIKAEKYALDEISAMSGFSLEEVKKLSAELQS